MFFVALSGILFRNSVFQHSTSLRRSIYTHLVSFNSSTPRSLCPQPLLSTLARRDTEFIAMSFLSYRGSDFLISGLCAYSNQKKGDNRDGRLPRYFFPINRKLILVEEVLPLCPVLMYTATEFYERIVEFCEHSLCSLLIL